MTSKAISMIVLLLTALCSCDNRATQKVPVTILSLGPVGIDRESRLPYHIIRLCHPIKSKIPFTDCDYILPQAKIGRIDVSSGQNYLSSEYPDESNNSTQQESVIYRNLWTNIEGDITEENRDSVTKYINSYLSAYKLPPAFYDYGFPPRKQFKPILLSLIDSLKNTAHIAFYHPAASKIKSNTFQSFNRLQDVQQFIEAAASDKSLKKDIVIIYLHKFSYKSTWLNQYQSKILPCIKAGACDRWKVLSLLSESYVNAWENAEVFEFAHVLSPDLSLLNDYFSADVLNPPLFEKWQQLFQAIERKNVSSLR